MSDLTCPMREDGVERAAIAIWVHLTKEQVAAIERFADSAGNLSRRDLLRKMSEDAIEKAINSKGKNLPINRELWAHKRRGSGSA